MAMDNRVGAVVGELAPLVRSLGRGRYGIALGGAHAKGVDDAESDIDIYLFADEALPNDERARLCREFSPHIDAVVAWGDTANFEQAGSDFHYGGRKVECWLRGIRYVSDIIAECRAGIVRHSLVTWTVMGYYNYCTLSDLDKLVVVDDPHGVLANWKAAVRPYPPELRRAIVARFMQAALFWPDNFHYKSSVERADLIYVMGIVHQVAHNLIQVVFALNETYFPGDKKLGPALAHLQVRPPEFEGRIARLLYPGAAPDTDTLRRQRAELAALASEVKALTEYTHE